MPEAQAEAFAEAFRDAQGQVKLVTLLCALFARPGRGEEALDFMTVAALSYSRKGRTLLKGSIALNLGRLEFRFVILPCLLFILAAAITAGDSNRQVSNNY